MKQIVEFPTESGGSIFVEVDDASQDDRISLGESIVQTAQQTLGSALENIRPLANTIVSKVKNLNEPADEIEVKFGIKMSAELGAVIASGNAEINYEITLKWYKEPENTDAYTP